jgi:hypothetical protein
MSSKAKINWPSFGFFLIVASCALLLGLLCWGWHKPELDEAFDILSRRELESAPEFSERDIRLLQRVWDRHPGFSRAMVGKSSARLLEPAESGWFERRRGHLSVRPEADHPAQFSLEARGAPSDFPVTVKLTGKGFERKLELSANQPQPLELSTRDLKHPTILDLELTEANSHASSTPTLGLRVIASGAAPARDNP